MLFNSYLFVLVFLPLCLVGFFSLNRFAGNRAASLFLLGMSLWFYGYFNIRYLPIIIGSVLVNYFIYWLLKRDDPSHVRKGILLFAVLINLGVLFYYKYYDFFFENVNALFSADFTLKHLVLPLGISFFTFQQLSFVIDAYRREVPDYDFLNYALFVTYFPQLIAGPIVTHAELVPQLTDPQKRKLNWDNLANGLFLFTLGLSKKVLIADVFGTPVNWGYANLGSLNSTGALVVMLSYTAQIYFDFSGYCDMAMGIARMMNIDLPENFRSPYQARTIVEFWDRWHMTLTRFFTKYVYIPLGGSRKGAARTYLNIMIVFLISGLWHGAGWTFIFWGGLHGLFMVFTKRFQKVFDHIPAPVNWLITFAFVNVAWVFFRAETFSDALQLLKAISACDFGALAPEITAYFYIPEIWFVFRGLEFLGLSDAGQTQSALWFFLPAFVLMLLPRNAKQCADRFRPSPVSSIATVILLCWCVTSFAGVSTFLYFNF